MNNKNQTTNRLIKIILLFLFLISINIFFINNYSYASTKSKAEIGGYIAEFARNFARDYSQETFYSWTAWQRAAAYHGIKTSGISNDGDGHEYTDKYAVDCVGWVSMAIHQATGLDHPNVSSGASGFVTPQSLTKNTPYFELVSGTPQPGDILISPGGPHVMLYVGDGKMVDSGVTMRRPGAVVERNVTAYSPHYSQIARISDAGVAAINDEDLTTIFQGQGGIIGKYDDEEDTGFEYKGTANGSYGRSKYEFKFVVNNLTELTDWFVGITTYLSRAITIGWASIIEFWIDDLMELTTGVKTNLTIEKLVNNQVPILDVNFFNLSVAGGEKIEPDSIMYVIRENIAFWYYVIRNVSIIGLLVVLLYLGLRMAFSTISEEKAKYKEMLVNWTVSFVIVFSIHYIMIFILKLNESIIQIINLSLSGGEVSLYDTARSAAYTIKASVGMPGTIIYLALIYLLIKFLYIYFKRFLVVGILTFMAPIISIMYSIDKIKDNKSQSLSNWLKEYTFNVLIQSVHALLYTLFVGLALNVLGDSLMGGILAILLINFMLKAEGIFKKIFGIKSGSLKDALKETGKVIGSLKVGMLIVGANTKTVGVLAKPIIKPIKNVVGKTKEYKRLDKIDNIKNQLETAKKLGKNSVKVGKNTYDLTHLMKQDDFNAQKVASKILSKEEKMKKANKEQIKKVLLQAKNTVAANVEFVAGIGALAADETYGGAILAKAYGSYKKSINGVNKKNKHYRGKASGIKNILTAGAYNNIKNLVGDTKSYNNKVNKNLFNTQHEIRIGQLEKKINKRLDKLYNDPNVNLKELETLIEDTNVIVDEDTIFNITYQLEASMSTVVSAKLEMSQENTYKKLNDMANKDINVDELRKQISEITKGRNKIIKTDSKQFENDVKKDLIQMIARDTKKRQRDVTKEEIQEKLNKLTNQEKKTLIMREFLKSTNLTESANKMSRNIKKQKSNLKLENIDEIIDTIKSSTKIPINKKGYMKNFEELIKGEISNKDNISIGSVTKSEMDKYIAGLSNADLIYKIKVAGGCEGSLRKNRNETDEKYVKLVEDIKELRYHKSQLKGID